MDRDEWPRLHRYTKEILSSLNDESVILWDLYNEPAYNHYLEQIFPLVRTVFKWARKGDSL